MLRSRSLRFLASAAAMSLASGCGSEVVVENTGVGGAASVATSTHGSTSEVASTTGSNGPPACADDGGCFVGSCVVGSCVAGLCQFAEAPTGTPCDDGLFCTVGEHCVAGKCGEAGPADCPPPPGGGDCFVATCDEASDACVLLPGNDGSSCFSLDPCMENGICSGGKCVGAPTDCSALDTGCTKGVCDPMAGGCVAVPSPNGAMCDDGNPCTSNTTCNAGMCGGGTSGTTVFFSEDFHDNSKGWTLGNEWQIAPATASMPVSPFGPDPGVDHSPSADNGIAGVVIGGNADVMVHPFEYITSPVFSATGPDVTLRYWRWLNSDYTPWMTNSIEVWNGMAWVNVFITGGPPGVQDNGWALHEIDLSPHANGAMRIRFGMDVGQTGSFNVSSWNIDDVRVTGALCP